MRTRWRGLAAMFRRRCGTLLRRGMLLRRRAGWFRARRGCRGSGMDFRACRRRRGSWAHGFRSALLRNWRRGPGRLRMLHLLARWDLPFGLLGRGRMLDHRVSRRGLMIVLRSLRTRRLLLRRRILLSYM